MQHATYMHTAVGLLKCFFRLYLVTMANNQVNAIVLNYVKPLD